MAAVLEADDVELRRLVSAAHDEHIRDRAARTLHLPMAEAPAAERPVVLVSVLRSARAREDVDLLHLRLARDVVATADRQVVRRVGGGLAIAFSSVDEALDAAAVLAMKVDRLNAAPGGDGLTLAMALGPFRSHGDVSALVAEASPGGVALAAGIDPVPGRRWPVPAGRPPPGQPNPVVPLRRGAPSPVALPRRLVRAGRPFVGRGVEMARLRSAWSLAVLGEAQLGVLHGSPGIGKTALAQYLAEETHSDGALVLSGGWEEGSLVPYQAVVEAFTPFFVHAPATELRSYLGRDATEVARVVRVLAHRLPQLDVQPHRLDAERFPFFLAMEDLLWSLAGTRPTLVVLEDAQWADRSSVALVRHLRTATQARPGRLLVLLTYRDSEIRADRGVSMKDLEGAPSWNVTLGGLTEDEIADLVAIRGEPHPPGLAARLYQRTGGNPLFVEQELRSLRDDPAPAILAAGLIEDVEPARGTLHDAIARQLSRLSSTAFDTLKVASVFGVRFDIALLERISTRSRSELIAALEEAVGASLLVSAAGGVGEFAFVHALVREVAYEAMSPARRADVHAAAARAIEAVPEGSGGDRLADLARHFSAAGELGDPDRAIDYSVRAGRQARSRLAFDEAATFFLAAADLIERHEPDRRAQVCELLLDAGDAFIGAGDDSRKNETFRRAAVLARQLGFGALLGRAALGLGDPLEHRPDAGRTREIVELLDEALELLDPSGHGDHPLLLARAVAERALLQAAPAIYPDARRVSYEQVGRAVQEAQAKNDDLAIAWALLARLFVAWNPDVPSEERLQWARQLLRHARRVRPVDAHLVGWARGWQIVLFLELGRIGEVDRQIREIERLAARSQQAYVRWAPVVLHTLRALMKGDLEPAERLMWAAYSIRPNTPNSDSYLAAHLLALHREREQLIPLEPGVRALAKEDPAAVFRAPLTMLLCETGRLDEARQHLDELAADRFSVLDRDPPTSILATSLLAEATWRLRDARYSRALYDRLRSHANRTVVVTSAAGCLGAADHYLGLSAAATAHGTDDREWWDRAEAHLRAAIAFNRRIDAGLWVARARLDLAEVMIVRDPTSRRQAATSLLRRVEDWARPRGLTAVLRRCQAVAKLRP